MRFPFDSLFVPQSRRPSPRRVFYRVVCAQLLVVATCIGLQFGGRIPILLFRLDVPNHEMAGWVVVAFCYLFGLWKVWCGVPQLGGRNYFHQYKVEVATFDGSGENPKDVQCFIVAVSETDQTAKIAPDLSCDGVADMPIGQQ